MSPNSKNEAGNSGSASIGHSDTRIPDLNPSTLLSLKNKIESSLKSATAKTLTPESHSKPAGKRQDPIPSPSNTSHVNRSSSTIIKRYNNKHSNGLNRIATSTSASTQMQQPKKKRLRDRQTRDAGGSKSDVNRVKSKIKAPHHRSNKKTELEKAAIALGGTENDLELIAGAPSDSEMEIQGPDIGQGSAKCLGKDVLQFVRGLGVDKIDMKASRHSSESGGEDTNRFRDESIVLHNSIKTPNLNKSPLKSQPNISAKKSLPHLVGSYSLECLP